MQRVDSMGPGTGILAEAAAQAPASTPRRSPQKPGVTPGKLLLGALTVFALTGLALAALDSNSSVGNGAKAWVALGGFGLGVLISFVALLRSLSNAYLLRDAGGTLPSLGMALLSLFMMGVGAFFTLAMTMAFSRGRQLRRFGRILLPPVEHSPTWADARPPLENSSEAPSGLAQQWRENGRTEHASVASFARLTLDLMALGAPPALIAAANEDALDEIRHTEACFGLARALDGKVESPGPFPAARSARTLLHSRRLALVELAVASLIDGALHEGVSARVIAKLARRCAHPQIRDMLKQIAADEGRHAAHGWDVVEWCLAQGGASVAHALAGAARALPERMHGNLPRAARSGAWEAWGIHGEALEDSEYAATRALIVQRVHALVEQGLPRRTAA